MLGNMSWMLETGTAAEALRQTQRGSLSSVRYCNGKSQRAGKLPAGREVGR